ncbi:MAG: hypothetical protein LH650_10615, partial [Chloroflexi bacterium]|nr:hypothetical protein [Chloroflexota bacterium]
MRTRADPWHQGRARLLMALVAISALAPAAIVVAPGPVAAECGGGFTPMPLFTDVAKDARRIVIGTVEGEV